MCLIPALASGRFALDEEVLTPELAVEVPECGHEHAISRRQALTLGAGVAAGSLLGVSGARAAAAPAGGMDGGGDHVVMLGVNGGPILSAVHSQPSLMLVVNGTQYLVDCGGDAPRQLVNSGAEFTPVKEVFFTHHHFDHTAGLAELLTLGWANPTPLKPGLRLWGPPPLRQTVESIRDAYGFGATLFEEGLGYPPWRPIGTVHEFDLPHHGIVKVMEDDNVVVQATRVFHGPEVHDAYAYRFDIKATGRSVTFSGDTTPIPSLIALAEDCDLFIHEVQLNAAIPELLSHYAPSQRKSLSHHLHHTHTDVSQVPAIAKAAGAKRVAFCHYSLVSDVEMVRALALKANRATHYKGEIIAPSELDRLAV